MNPSEDASDTTGDMPDFAALFEKTPGLYLVLNISFVIVAANDAYCKATMTVRDEIVGRSLFQVFPDNPGDSSADGVQKLRTSLLEVLKTRQPHRMRFQRYDIQRRGVGGFEARYWSPLNIPVLGPDGYVKWIIHTVEDATAVADVRATPATQREESDEPLGVLAQLAQIRRELAATRDENAQLRETVRKHARG